MPGLYPSDLQCSLALYYTRLRAPEQQTAVLEDPSSNNQGIRPAAPNIRPP